MRGKGFPDYRHPRPEPVIDRFYGVIDVDQARIWGYRYAAVLDIEEQDDPYDTSPPTPIPMTEEEIALVGTDETRTSPMMTYDSGTGAEFGGRYDPDSCLHPSILAVQPLHDELGSLRSQLQEVSARASLEVEASDEFRAAFEDFAACVVEKGQAQPPMLDGFMTVFSDGPSASEEEISEAVAHAECTHESGFLREWSRLRVEEEHRLIEENPGLLTEYLELREEAYGAGG